ncbi:MAG: hypothetical protein IH957_12285 [Chloroflexi bacterium]|nr:hypothetical protein [Chloroflexota bacterium]
METLHRPFLRIGTRVVLPALPILIDLFADAISDQVVIAFPDRNVLVVAFLIPVIWLLEIRDELGRLMAIIFLVLAGVPYLLSLVSSERSIYWAGLAVAILAAVVFSTLELTSRPTSSGSTTVPIDEYTPAEEEQ